MSYPYFFKPRETPCPKSPDGKHEWQPGVDGTFEWCLYCKEKKKKTPDYVRRI